ncbi:MAG: hypothetical protein RL092_145 [Bacteroidota bacterium]
MKRILGCIILIVFWACSQVAEKKDKPIAYQIPSFFPEMDIPADNMPSEARMELGKKLFYDVQLSRDYSHHCGSCHALSAAFTDGQRVSVIHENSIKRNAPTLVNLAWSPYLMAEGGVPNLELQALAPIHESHEFNLSMQELILRLQENEEYELLSQRAYQRSIDAFVITRALACFQRSFISGDSKFDRVYYLKQENFSVSEQRGFDLFFSDQTQCSSCHAPPFFTSYEFASLGLTDGDEGLKRKTYREEDAGKFKTPTLRNIEITGPYMHNGSFGSLEEVIEFYNAGGGPGRNKSNKINPLLLTEQEKQDLVAFLKTLTDWNFVQNAKLVRNE